MTVLMSATGLTLDPSDLYTFDGNAITSDLLLRSLTQQVYDPATRAMKLVPDLATTLGHHNRDYTVWRFTLRSGVRFANGQQVTPQEVKFGIERSFDKTSFPDGAPYSTGYFLDGATYQGPYRSPGPYRGVTVSGRTLTLRMAHPFPDLPWFASFPEMGPVPLGRVSNPATYKYHPWTTGPYKVARYVPQKLLVLVRNPEWDPRTDPGRHQYVDRWVFHLDDAEGAIDRLMASGSGTAQTTIAIPIAQDDITRLQRAAPSTLVWGTKPCTYMLEPDNRKVTDVRVRRAIAFAFPYRATLRAKGLVPGVTGEFAASLLPPNIAGQQPYDPVPGHRPGTTEPTRARHLLARANALGYPIRWAYQGDDAPDVAVKNAMVRAFRKAGFQPEPVRSSLARIATDYSTNKKSDINLRQVGWCADWPSGITILPSLLTGPDVSSPLFGDFAQFSSAAVNARVRTIERLPLGRQPAAWSALEQRVETSQLPIIPLYYQRIAIAHGPRVHGANFNTTLMMPTYDDVWIG